MKFIPNHDKLCLTEEQAQHVYEAVKSGEPVQPYMSNVDLGHFASNIKDVNPYHAGLHARVDTEMFHEPVGNGPM